jgi:hypothetical protein
VIADVMIGETVDGNGQDKVPPAGCASNTLTVIALEAVIEMVISPVQFVAPPIKYHCELDDETT